VAKSALAHPMRQNLPLIEVSLYEIMMTVEGKTNANCESLEHAFFILQFRLKIGTISINMLLFVI